MMGRWVARRLMRSWRGFRLAFGRGWGVHRGGEGGKGRELFRRWSWVYQGIEYVLERWVSKRFSVMVRIWVQLFPRGSQGGRGSSRSSGNVL